MIQPPSCDFLKVFCLRSGFQTAEPCEKRFDFFRFHRFWDLRFRNSSILIMESDPLTGMIFQHEGRSGNRGQQKMGEFKSFL